MAWYGGSVGEAVQESKNSSKLFVVFVAGKDDDSTKMDDTWTNEEVQNICQKKCVCLKLEVDSVPCKQFSQIYPVVVVPVTFFIGKNGIPIEIIPGYIQAEDMRLKLLGATQDKVETSSNNEANTSESMTSQSPCEEPLTLPHETTSFSDDEPFKSDQASANTRSAPSPSQTDVVDKEEQVQKLQEKINQRRLDKLKEAEEEEQRREIERRKLGKDVKSMREKQEKMKILKDLEERKKDKQMEIEARRKVREQLAQDRLERNSKFQQEQEEKRREGDIIKKQREMQMTQEEQEKKREREKIARIQYRLPDGSSVTRNYPRDETLGSAIADLRNQPVQIPENFRLSMGIPRRIFSQEDERVSLGDLGLTPSASVLVQPVNNKKIQPKQDGMMAQCLAYVIMFLSFPLKMVSYMWSAIFGPQQSTSNEVVGGTSQSSDIRRGSGTQSVRRRNVPDKPVKRDGKTHRLSDVNREDDDEATWNGNSTQQM